MHISLVTDRVVRKRKLDRGQKNVVKNFAVRVIKTRSHLNYFYTSTYTYKNTFKSFWKEVYYYTLIMLRRIILNSGIVIIFSFDRAFGNLLGIVYKLVFFFLAQRILRIALI